MTDDNNPVTEIYGDYVLNVARLETFYKEFVAVKDDMKQFESMLCELEDLKEELFDARDQMGAIVIQIKAIWQILTDKGLIEA